MKPHKLALRAIGTGAPMRRYGQVIGVATQPIAPGDHVHAHNLGVQAFAPDYAVGADVRPLAYLPPSKRRTFRGVAKERA